jgi:bile acid:Na+ symporter, BASS family
VGNPVLIENQMISKFNVFIKSYGKVLSLLLVMICGALLPQFQSFSFLVQYLLMGMLFFAFLDIDFNPKNFQKSILWILFANLAIAFLSYWLLSYFDRDLALAAFITAIAPTAISSPVIISFIEGQVEYVAASVLITNISIALVVPFALPALAQTSAPISAWQVLQPVLITMFVPLVLARVVSHLPQAPQAMIRTGKRYSFTLWLLNLFIICAKAADFMRTENSGSIGMLLRIGLVSLVICVINFALGAFIGGRHYWQESSQALGQKNNTFVIWLALTFINPLIAMGPTFYVLYHNLYNSWQIYLFEKRRVG